MTYPTCPRCGATITSKGVSHSGRPGGQWECRCGYILDSDRPPVTDPYYHPYGCVCAFCQADRAQRAAVARRGED